MTRKELEALTAAHALGSLDPADAAPLEALLAHDPEAREEAAAFRDTIATTAAASTPHEAPTPELRAKILAMLPDIPQASPAPTLPAIPGFTFTLRSDEGWMDMGAPGFRAKVLSGGDGRGHQVILAELAPGGKVPEHDHTGTEDLFVLSGHLRTEGRTLGPGDFLHAEPGTHHHELISPDGCTALLIVGAASH
jgi:putative transcriptional regulator